MSFRGTRECRTVVVPSWHFPSVFVGTLRRILNLQKIASHVSQWNVALKALGNLPAARSLAGQLLLAATVFSLGSVYLLLRVACNWCSPRSKNLPYCGSGACKTCGRCFAQRWNLQPTARIVAFLNWGVFTISGWCRRSSFLAKLLSNCSRMTTPE